jgi:thioredoxin reductase (NADPH)
LVIGGGNSAGEEGIFLAKFARHVTIATRDAALSASRAVVQKIHEVQNMEVLTQVTPAAFQGDKHLQRVILRDIRSGEQRTLTPDGVFVFIGLTPNTGFLKNRVSLDERGFVLTGPDLATSVPGIFAAGDCRAGSTKQAASAAGEGAAVALAIRRYIEPRAGGKPTCDMERSEADAVMTM